MVRLIRRDALAGRLIGGFIGIYHQDVTHHTLKASDNVNISLIPYHTFLIPVIQLQNNIDQSSGYVDDFSGLLAFQVMLHVFTVQRGGFCILLADVHRDG